jgi:hypothetical protein
MIISFFGYDWLMQDCTQFLMFSSSFLTGTTIEKSGRLSKFEEFIGIFAA